MAQETQAIPEYWGKAFVDDINFLTFYAESISPEARLRLDRLLKDKDVFKIATGIVKRPKTSYSDLSAIADFLVAAATLPDTWDHVTGEARGLPKPYSQSVHASCNQISGAIRRSPARYDVLFGPQGDDRFSAADVASRITLFLRMLSAIGDQDKAHREISLDPVFDSDSAPPVPRKIGSRSACEVYVIQQLSHKSNWMFGSPLHNFVARVATIVFNRRTEIDPERVQDLWKAVLKTRKAG